MKITFIIPEYDSLVGGLRVVSQYADYMSRRGHAIHLVSGDGSRKLGLRARLRKMLLRDQDNTNQDNQKTGFFDDLNLDVTFISPNKSIPEDCFPDADIIIATWWKTAEWMRHLPKNKGKHVHFIQDHEIFPNQPIEKVKNVYRQPTEKIVVSSWLSEVIQKDYGQVSHIIPNGIDTVTFNAPQRSINKKFTVGFLYSPSPRKNINLALEALYQARNLVPDLQAVVFGSSQIDFALPNWVQYEFRPSQKRIAEIYGSCDAWIFTSKSEGFGLPILEAMACRTPVLATAAGAAPDLVTGKNGRIVPSEPESFAQAMSEIAGMRDADWKAMSDAARHTAEANDISAAADKFEKLLSRMMTH